MHNHNLPGKLLLLSTVLDSSKSYRGLNCISQPGGVVQLNLTAHYMTLLKYMYIRKLPVYTQRQVSRLHCQNYINLPE